MLTQPLLKPAVSAALLEFAEDTRAGNARTVCRLRSQPITTAKARLAAPGAGAVPVSQIIHRY